MAAAIAAALALLATPALAATVTWTGAGLCLPTNWSTNNCWVGGVPTTGDDVVLAQSGGVGPVNYNLNVTLQSLTLNTPTFGGSNYTIANTGGGILGLQSGGFITDNSTSIVGTINTGITLNGPATFTLSAGATGLVFGVKAITGTAPLTLVNNSGNDALQLNFANTYTGATTINGTGRVYLSVNGAIPTGSALTVNGSALFNAGSTIGSLAGGGNVLLNGNNTLTVGGDNSSTTFSGVYQDVNGSAALTKTGSGTFTLSGVNTYTGGSTVSGGLVNFSALSNLGSGNVTLNGGGLQWATGTTTDISPRLNALGAGGATFDTNGNSVTFASALTGIGALTKTGTGTLTLSGANTYSGGTTINAGALSGNTTSLQGAITNNAMVTFDQAVNGTYAGVMSGTGGLVKSGAGILTLSGANTYTGGTTVNAGTLRAGAANAFGSGGAPSVASGATLDLNGFNQTLGSLTGAGNIALGTAMLTVGGDNADSTFSGVISGTGGLIKNGTGKTILSGANTYTGDTNINGGILSVNGSIASNVFVNSGGTLGGSGTINGAVTVNSGGVIAPGNSPGIITVNSLTLNSGSTTRMEINGLTAGTQHDQIVVNNTATLGGTLDLVFGFTPAVGNRFTLIQAANIVPGFAAIQDNVSANFGAAIQLRTITSATTFDLLINQGSFVPFALTHNQRSAALMLDSQYAAWGATRLINRLDTLSAAQLPGVLNSLSGEQHTHGQSMARRLGTQFNSLLLSRLDAVDGERTHGWNFWLKGLGGFGRLDADGNAGRSNNNSGGFAMGADTELNDHAVLGAAASYTSSNVDTITANLGMDSYQLSGYGKWHRDDNYIKGTLGAGFHQTDSRRTVFEDSASASYGSATAGTALEAGRNVALLEHTTLTPYAGMQYQHLNRNNFTETGSDLANLKVREADEDSFRTLLGARLSQIVKTGWGVSIQPSLHAAWVQEHGDRISRMAADFAAAPAAVYRVNGPQLDRSRAAVGAGLVTQFSKTAQLNVAYNAELAKSDNWHTLSATFEYRW